jgi:hypothetical protein
MALLYTTLWCTTTTTKAPNIQTSHVPKPCHFQILALHDKEKNGTYIFSSQRESTL